MTAEGMDSNFSGKVLALQEAMAVTDGASLRATSGAICLIGQPHSGKSRVIESCRA